MKVTKGTRAYKTGKSTFEIKSEVKHIWLGDETGAFKMDEWLAKIEEVQVQL